MSSTFYLSFDNDQFHNDHVKLQPNPRPKAKLKIRTTIHYYIDFFSQTLDFIYTHPVGFLISQCVPPSNHPIFSAIEGNDMDTNDTAFETITKQFQRFKKIKEKEKEKALNSTVRRRTLNAVQREFDLQNLQNIGTSLLLSL